MVWLLIVPAWAVMAYLWLSMYRLNRDHKADRVKAKEEDEADKARRAEYEAKRKEAEKAIDQIKANIYRALVESENGGKVPKGEN